MIYFIYNLMLYCYLDQNETLKRSLYDTCMRQDWPNTLKCYFLKIVDIIYVFHLLI